MTHLGNSPAQHTVLRLEARKSFALGVFLADPNGRPVDLSGSTLTLVSKLPGDTSTDDYSNIFGFDAVAHVEDPEFGFARFRVQAATLDIPAGEYPFAIVLLSEMGYSSVLVKGTMEMVDNPEYYSAQYSYSEAQPSQTLNLLLENRSVLRVTVGHAPPPGMGYVRDSVVELLESFDPDDIAMLPRGGAPGTVMTKTGSQDYEVAWRPVGNGPNALDAAGQPAGYAPVALGDGTWDWAAALSVTDSEPNSVPVSDGDGNYSWTPAEEIAPQTDWSLPASSPGGIRNKPSLNFMPSTTLVSNMPGVHIVDTPPTSGQNGHLYFVIES